MDRQKGFELNQALREGREKARKLDDGYVALNIPEKDFYALRAMFPELTSEDSDIRLAAWKRFIASPFSEPYRVVRSPQAVQRSAAPKIILN